MGLRAGIVGLPNVGKSTIFNALTAGHAPAENYPFCTVEPNVGRVTVPDERLSRIASLVEHKQLIPATLDIVDIAGLVKGASKGEGLGNRFLSHIREVNAILHVVRCFDDPNVAHVHTGLDPVGDIEIVETELIIADLESIEKRLDMYKKMSQGGIKEAKLRYESSLVARETLEKGVTLHAAGIDSEVLSGLDELFLLTTKPVMYIANIGEEGLLGGNETVDAVKHYAREHRGDVVPICGKIEAELIELEPADREVFLKEMGLEEPGLNRVIRATYKLLGLHSFFTMQSGIIQAWDIPLGTRAPQAAGTIHTDFEKGFIRAEVCALADLVKCGSEQAVRASGRMRQEGKEYVVEDGDIIHFKFNV